MLNAMRLVVLLLLAIPETAAIVAALLGPRRQHAIRWICLGATLADAFLACILAARFMQIRAEQGGPAAEPGRLATFQPEFVPGADPADSHRTTWNMLRFSENGAIQFYVGVDGINVWLVALTALLMVSGVLISWNAISERTNEYYAWMLALGTGMLGVFLAFDIILFYVFFELTLVPLVFLIGIWGGPERRHAARKFFVYTLVGSSMITFLGLLLAIVVVCYDKSPAPVKHLTFSIPELVRIVNENLRTDSLALEADRDFWASFQFWVFFSLCLRGSPSRCRYSRSTPGCHWPTSRRRRREACCWPACC